MLNQFHEGSWVSISPRFYQLICRAIAFIKPFQRIQFYSTLNRILSKLLPLKFIIKRLSWMVVVIFEPFRDVRFSAKALGYQRLKFCKYKVTVPVYKRDRLCVSIHRFISTSLRRFFGEVYRWSSHFCCRRQVTCTITLGMLSTLSKWDTNNQDRLTSRLMGDC